MQQLAPHARARLRVRRAAGSAKRVGVDRDVAGHQQLLLVAEDARGEQVQEAVLAVRRQRVMQAGGRLEQRAALATRADERGDLLDGRHACAAATELRLPIAEHDVTLALLRAVDDRKELRIIRVDLVRPDDEPVDEPRVVRRSDSLPLRERRFQRKLRRREDARVVPSMRQQCATRVGAVHRADGTLPCVFTAAERDELRTELLERARADEQVVAAAITGSSVVGAEDEWSDIDLAFGVADGVGVETVLASWTQFMSQEHGLLHHWDLVVGPTTYRVFLLPDLLQVDIASSPVQDFVLYTPTFRSVFGPYVERERAQPKPDDETIGWAWVYAIHARRCIERNRPWQAEMFISSTRDSTIKLACIRLGLPAAFGRGVDQLPDDVKQALEPAIVRSLEETELRRALKAATDALLTELRHADATLAERLAEPLQESAG